MALIHLVIWGRLTSKTQECSREKDKRIANNKEKRKKKKLVYNNSRNVANIKEEKFSYYLQRRLKEEIPSRGRLTRGQ